MCTRTLAEFCSTRARENMAGSAALGGAGSGPKHSARQTMLMAPTLVRAQALRGCSAPHRNTAFCVSLSL